MADPVKIGILTVSDRASRGEYEDRSGPAIEAYLRRAISTPWEPVKLIIPDGRASVREAAKELCDERKVGLLLITGGTGPAPRDETPEGVADIAERELPGFGELMRRVSLETVPTAILSRQGGSLRGSTLIVTLPGKPAAIDVCLQAVFPAVPYCLDLIGAGHISTDPQVVTSFRPGT
ncbi:MAG: molybdopterin adenylyltransferase [Devosia sp.]|uniref:molybdopterin adenylyltransferase n=1 Tax=Devosia sp. 66-22 TaxID=1895753 RepID=UPI000926EF4B|nr:molybdopterin adenylyltransferase [Devosia sp. 66-22]MBN9347502.1 molybdopterin adenylyltransferase [Devosia sp.]OJX47817.1 MAG: molybdopterin adenylyltransferase [Devosia sp. 66-22]